MQGAIEAPTAKAGTVRLYLLPDGGGPVDELYKSLEAHGILLYTECKMNFSPRKGADARAGAAVARWPVTLSLRHARGADSGLHPRRNWGRAVCPETVGPFA